MRCSKLYLVSRVTLVLGASLLSVGVAIVVLAGLIGLLLVYTGYVTESIWVELVAVFAPTGYILAVTAGFLVTIAAVADNKLRKKGKQ